MVSQRRIAPALLPVVVMAVSVLAAPSSGGRDAGQTETQDLELWEAKGNARASARLMKELVETMKSDGYKKGLFQAELVNDNLYEWEVKLFFPDPKDGLHQDLVELKTWLKNDRDYMLLRMTIPDDYPYEMPLVRIVYPIISGRPTGALCMYLLSPQGWLPDCTMESLILTIRDHVLNNGSHRVYFDQTRHEYSGEGSDEERKKYVEFHGWDKPRPEDKAWYEGPESEKN